MPRITPDPALDLYNYLDVVEVPPARRRSAVASAKKVTDDWPDPVPISEQEIAVFESWFGDILEQLFGPG